MKKLILLSLLAALAACAPRTSGSNYNCAHYGTCKGQEKENCDLYGGCKEKNGVWGEKGKTCDMFGNCKGDDAAKEDKPSDSKSCGIWGCSDSSSSKGGCDIFGNCN